MIVQAAKAYLETEHETTFRFNPQTFIDKVRKSTDVYSPLNSITSGLKMSCACGASPFIL